MQYNFLKEVNQALSVRSDSLPTAEPLPLSRPVEPTCLPQWLGLRTAVASSVLRVLATPLSLCSSWALDWHTHGHWYGCEVLPEAVLYM